jgi:hypothetical protein
MELTQNMSTLFAQLGLPSEKQQIDKFIETHRPLPDNMLLQDAHFWTLSQATFLDEEILRDADWASVIDEMNAGLHSHG